MMVHISTEKGTNVTKMDVGFPYADRMFYEGIKEDKLVEFPGLVLNVNKGTKSLKAKAFPPSYLLVPKGMAISTARGTSLKYL